MKRAEAAPTRDAQREHLGSSLAALRDGSPVQEPEMRPMARTARLAGTNAEAIVARSLSEPQTRRIDADQSRGMLIAWRRLAQAG